MDDLARTRHPEVNAQDPASASAPAPVPPSPPPHPERPVPPLWQVAAYPFLGRGKYLFPIGALLLAAGEWSISTFLSYGMGGNLILMAVSALLTLTIYGYVGLHLISMIGSSALGEDEPPDWPDVQTWTGALRGLLLFAGVLGMSFAPGFCLYRWGASLPGYAALYRGLLGLGVLYLPMGLLSVAIHDSIDGLNPVTIVLGIARAGPIYLLSYAVIPVGLLAYSLGSILSSLPFLAEAVWLYVLIVQMRILGLIYRARARKLDWFPQD